MIALLSAYALGGGGPLNVVVLHNADSEQSTELASHYVEQRDIPTNQLCPIYGVQETEQAIQVSQYVEFILDELTLCLENVPDPDLIDYLVVVRGLPHRVDLEGGSIGLNAALQLYRSEHDGELLVEQLPDHTALPWNPEAVYPSPQSGDFTLSNPYEGSYRMATGTVRSEIQPESFKRVGVQRSNFFGDFTDQLFVVTRLDGFDYEDAHALIDRAVSADGSFPQAPFLCMASSDEARGARDPECEFVVRHLESLGVDSVWIPEFDGELSGYEVSGYFTGTANLHGAIDGLTYVPGAIACNLTSFGAVPNNFFCSEDGTVCPESEAQTSVARFVRAGVSAVHGTVAEPYNHVFPGAGTMLLYAMGYSMGESFFFNTNYLHWMTTVIGDPLMMPFDTRPEVSFGGDSEHPFDEPMVFTADHPNGISKMSLYVNNVLEHEEEGSTLTWMPLGRDGDTEDVFVVAEAQDRILEVPGWPIEETTVRNRPQGWNSFSVLLGPSALIKKDVQKGCAHIQRRSLFGLWMVFMLVCVRQRFKGRRPKWV